MQRKSVMNVTPEIRLRAVISRIIAQLLWALAHEEPERLLPHRHIPMPRWQRNILRIIERNSDILPSGLATLQQVLSHRYAPRDIWKMLPQAQRPDAQTDSGAFASFAAAAASGVVTPSVQPHM